MVSFLFNLIISTFYHYIDVQITNSFTKHGFQELPIYLGTMHALIPITGVNPPKLHKVATYTTIPLNYSMVIIHTQCQSNSSRLLVILSFALVFLLFSLSSISSVHIHHQTENMKTALHRV